MEATLLLMQEKEEAAPAARQFFFFFQNKTLKRGPEAWPWVENTACFPSILFLNCAMLLCLSLTSLVLKNQLMQHLAGPIPRGPADTKRGWLQPSVGPRRSSTILRCVDLWVKLGSESAPVLRRSGSRRAAVKPQNQPKCASDDSAFPFISCSESCVSCRLPCRGRWMEGGMNLQPL